MEWLKDPKNQPIVAAIAAVVIIGVGIFYYFNFIKAPAPEAPVATDTAAAPPTDPAAAPAAGTDPAATGGAPAAPAATPAATPAADGSTPAAATAAAAPAAGGTQVASVTPMETWRSDPFLPIGHTAKKVVRVAPPIRDFPFVTLPGVHISRTVKREQPEIQQPPRRMAGILLNDRVYAIIESNGGSEVVQPGDYLKDRLAMVQKIEPDKVVLKTVDQKPRYITVRMASSAHQVTPVFNNAGGGAVGNVPMPPPSRSSRPSGPAPGVGGPPE